LLAVTEEEQAELTVAADVRGLFGEAA